MDGNQVRVSVVSCSLSKNSRSFCRRAHSALETLGCLVEWVDLQNHRILPYGMDGSEGVEAIQAVLNESHGVVLGFPVYNYSMNSSLKALIELRGRTMEGEVIGLMMSAGSRASALSDRRDGSLIYDFRTWIVPRFTPPRKRSTTTERASAAKTSSIGWPSWHERSLPRRDSTSSRRRSEA